MNKSQAQIYAENKRLQKDNEKLHRMVREQGLRIAMANNKAIKVLDLLPDVLKVLGFIIKDFRAIKSLIQDIIDLFAKKGEEKEPEKDPAKDPALVPGAVPLKPQTKVEETKDEPTLDYNQADGPA